MFISGACRRQVSSTDVAPTALLISFLVRVLLLDASFVAGAGWVWKANVHPILVVIGSRDPVVEL